MTYHISPLVLRYNVIIHYTFELFLTHLSDLLINHRIFLRPYRGLSLFLIPINILIFLTSVCKNLISPLILLISHISVFSFASPISVFSPAQSVLQSSYKCNITLIQLSCLFFCSLNFSGSGREIQVYCRSKGRILPPYSAAHK